MRGVIATTRCAESHDGEHTFSTVVYVCTQCGSRIEPAVIYPRLPIGTLEYPPVVVEASG